MENKCIKGNCVFVKQGTSCLYCSHSEAIKYIELTDKCECGRTNKNREKGCGRCIGRGKYIYPCAYEQCDCNGYKKKE